MSIGEVGSITTPAGVSASDPITITLDAPLTNPVYAFSATSHDGDPFTLRVVNETTDADGNVVSFDVVIEEYAYLDGVHATPETINWVAVEEGVHILPDGRILQAGTVEAGSTASQVELSTMHTEPPVVLTSVMSNNESTPVDSDPYGITAEGFTVRLQEEEALRSTGHVAETVGWIAIQPGGDETTGTASTGTTDHYVSSFALDPDFQDPLVFTEEQTQSGPDTTTVRLADTDGDPHTAEVFLEEETSRDTETGHMTETVALVAFDAGTLTSSASFACYAAGTHIGTPDGPRRIEHLRPGDLLTTAGGGTTRLRLALHRTVPPDAPRALWPIRFAPGALGPGLPHAPLLVSAQHRMLVAARLVARMFGADAVLVAAHRLLPLPGVTRVPLSEPLTYWHLLCDRHSILSAEGAWSESLLPGPQALASFQPDQRAAVRRACPALLFGLTPPPAAPIPSGQRQRGLVRRMVRNGHPAQPPEACALSAPKGWQTRIHPALPL